MNLGHSLGILAPNGTGKTTIVNMMAGEECDGGGETPACDGDCTPSECGDGTTNVAAGEQCDDAGESAACDVDCTVAFCGDGVVNMSAGEQCDGGPVCDAACQLDVNCNPDPVAAAMALCMTQFSNCVIETGGVVGWDPPECTGCNCGPPTDPWRWYCTADDPGGTNWNCAPCLLGEILGPHDPCMCGAGTSPVLGNFCAP